MTTLQTNNLTQKTETSEPEPQATSGVNNHLAIIHESNLYAEPIAHVGNFAVTNTIFTSWIVAILLIIVSVSIKKKIKEIPSGIQNIFEVLVEEGEKLCDQITGSRKITETAFPVVLTIFIVVLINNWFGLLPLGGLGILQTAEHGRVFIPFFRSGTSDINGTLALAIVSVISANIFGIVSIGIWKTLNRYVNLKTLGNIFTKVRKDPMVLIVSPIMFAVGLIETISEVAKVISLSFRLFGNIFAGEVLLASMGAILAYILPTPFYFLEIFVGAIQAFIFAVLTLVYYTISATDEEYEEEHDKGEGEIIEATY